MSIIAKPGSPRTGAVQIVIEMEESLTSKHPDLHALLAYYQARRNADGVLPRAAVEPRDLLPLLPHLYIAEPAEAGEWRFRLMGTALVDRLGRDFTWKPVSAAYHGATAARVAELYRRVTRERRSIITRGRFVGPGLDHLRGESFQAPLLGADGRTMMVFGGLFFQ